MARVSAFVAAVITAAVVVDALFTAASATEAPAPAPMSGAGEKKLYEAKVWEKAWENFKQLQSFELVGDAAVA
uniref:Cysteine proteinase inhibitor n=1 Tax=Zea mays TaxID=4577 RepID=B6U1U1_MAIZE|nr:hypothetical protein [Zea mays]